MSDQDRNAFISLCSVRFGLKGSHFISVEGVYCNESIQAGWVAWQAARDYYAPKVTEADVVNQVARAIHNACAELEKPYPTAIPCYSMNKNKAGWEVMAKAALRAAGIKFRDEP